jgi:hypothetical protein
MQVPANTATLHNSQKWHPQAALQAPPEVRKVLLPAWHCLLTQQILLLLLLHGKHDTTS